jgi:hypothetical protein
VGLDELDVVAVDCVLNFFIEFFIPHLKGALARFIVGVWV